MFRITAAALRVDAERIRDCARTLHRGEDAAALLALAERCATAAAALEAQSRQLAAGVPG